MESKLRAAPEVPARRTQVTLRLEGQPAEDVDVAAYALDSDGRLLASAPVKDGAAQLTLSEEEAGRATILVGPALRGRCAPPPTKAALERMHAYEPKVTYDSGTRAYELAPVPEVYWRLLKLLAACTEYWPAGRESR